MPSSAPRDSSSRWSSSAISSRMLPEPRGDRPARVSWQPKTAQRPGVAVYPCLGHRECARPSSTWNWRFMAELRELVDGSDQDRRRVPVDVVIDAPHGQGAGHRACGG